LAVYEGLPLNNGEGARYLQGRIGTDPPEYYLAIFPNEKRLHVHTQLERYNNGKDLDSEFAGHIVACGGEISPATGEPDVMVLQSTDKEAELFELCTYNKDKLLSTEEQDEFANTEEELGNFSLVTGTIKGKRAKGQNQGNYDYLPLLLRVPGNVAQLFMDSPNLAVAHLRLDSAMSTSYSEEERQALEKIPTFIGVGLHSRDETHSILASEWVAADDEIAKRMARKMKGRLQQTESEGTGRKGENKWKSNTLPRSKRRQRIPLDLFAARQQVPPTGAGGNTHAAARSANTGSNVSTDVMLEILRENNKMMIEQMQGFATLNAQAMQSQGVGGTSTKLTPADKKTWQAAAGFEVAADFGLSEVYAAADGPEGKSDEKFSNALCGILTPPANKQPQPRVHTTDSLAKDLRKLNLAHRNSLVVDSLAKGLTIFAVLNKEHAQMDREDNQRLIYWSATYHTMEDVERRETEFKLCLPHDYRSCKMALVNYEFVLEKAIGGRCPHWEWVKKILNAWSDKEKELEPVVTTWHCVHLLWAIHHDARTFFWNCVSWRQGPVPDSQLRFTWMNLMNSQIVAQIHCPYKAILEKFGAEAEPETAAAVVPIQRNPAGKPGTQAKAKRNAKFPDGVKVVVKKLRAKCSKVSFAMLNARGAEGCNFRGLRIGAPGTCIDFALLGCCKNEGCTYNHVVAKPNDVRVETVTKHLENGLAALSLA